MVAAYRTGPPGDARFQSNSGLLWRIGKQSEFSIGSNEGAQNGVGRKCEKQGGPGYSNIGHGRWIDGESSDRPDEDA
jgi:hypothetical protein